MSPLQVTVAALGSPFPFVFAAPWGEDDAGHAVAYDRRPQTRVEASPELSLREALGIAAEALGGHLSNSPDARGLRESYGQSDQLEKHLVYADFTGPLTALRSLPAGRLFVLPWWTTAEGRDGELP
jgi:hypothetical protein